MSQATEALRQQRLLAVLRAQAPLDTLSGWLRGPPARAQRGLQAYTANAGALAERALSAAFPTIAELVGAGSFAALARAFWQAQPPERGDVAQWGGALPGFIAAAAQLADEPCLADVARLDWAVHLAELASDADRAAQGLEQLATADPDRLRLQLAPGTALVSSTHPVATIWQAHRSSATDRFAPVRQAFALGAAEHGLVWRQGYRAQVTALPEAAAGFTHAVLAGRSLGQALAGAAPDFDFETWLLAALQQGWIAAAIPHTPPAPHAPTPGGDPA